MCILNKISKIIPLVFALPALCYMVIADAEAGASKFHGDIPSGFGSIAGHDISECINISGSYDLVALNSLSIYGNSEMGLKLMSLDRLLDVPSHNWPLKYPLLENKTVDIQQIDSASVPELRLRFNVESRPYEQQVSVSRCVNGWLNIKINGKGYSEGGVIEYHRDLYLIINNDGNLIAKSHLEERMTGLLTPFGQVTKGSYWYKFRRKK